MTTKRSMYIRTPHDSCVYSQFHDYDTVTRRCVQGCQKSLISYYLTVTNLPYLNPGLTGTCLFWLASQPIIWSIVKFRSQPRTSASYSQAFKFRRGNQMVSQHSPKRAKVTAPSDSQLLPSADRKKGFLELPAGKTLMRLIVQNRSTNIEYCGFNEERSTMIWTRLEFYLQCLYPPRFHPFQACHRTHCLHSQSKLE